ncbi:hypothetical protein FRC11_002008, partial [Ceratobasidium sp. 423]
EFLVVGPSSTLMIVLAEYGLIGHPGATLRLLFATVRRSLTPARLPLSVSRHPKTSPSRCRLATEVQSRAIRGQKQEVDISRAFPSLSGVVHGAFPPRFSRLKKDLVSTTEARDRLVAGWIDLLGALREGVAELQAKGNEAIPEVNFAEIERGDKSWQEDVRKRRSVVFNDVVDDAEALGWKQQVWEYAKENPQVKGFPVDNKQVFELYWFTTSSKYRMGHF